MFELHDLFCVAVVQQEKAHQNLLNGVEHFDKSSMKHAETQEKNPLPDPAGILLSNFLCFYYVVNALLSLHSSLKKTECKTVEHYSIECLCMCDNVPLLSCKL